MPTSQTLTLAVAARQAAQFGSRSSKVFNGTGGSIGRSEDCDWVLSASGVSRVHAMIRYLNGMYFIEDRSTNGMLLNGTPLIKGDPSALKDGDELLIDTFEVGVSLGDGAAATPSPVAVPVPPLPGSDDPLDFGLSDILPPAPAGHAAAVIPPDDGLIPGGIAGTPSASELDPLSFLEPAGSTSGLLSGTTTGNTAGSTTGGTSPGWNHSAGTEDYFRPPATAGAQPVDALPENWDLTIGDFSAPPASPPAPAVAPPEPPPPAPAPPVAAQVGAAVGLPQDVDQIFRVVVDGVMEVLRARAEIKNTFRLPVTIIQRSENNPLKFAPTPDEALQKIMAPSNAAFMSGSAAFEDAFDDIRCHQMAMLAGVRAAFESLMTHFNPDRFEQETDGSKRSAFAGKGKYWDRYREHFEGLSRDPDDCFRRLFGDEFARAYEEQLSRLKSARRMQKAGHQ